ncbi:MarR family winged helix-turn-helix transcriptional regulator [Agrobacterium rubi]|uniref:MarR family transcriptional regulator n=2 Tax=Agrobacterium rubi TaxID=28099 RepID=A0AAE7UQS0_9HYPH|nr:MarR family transcriptional regulator [Agrobacterium rubi]MBP1877463.1 DNA-binding MarR family transcriptional regulator [Agrobacterium rubi]MCL6651639.1 MarR family transcriptional regulator [Agrobacterium rubi]NTE89217.1 MarR family transcriptional regulator [Agrobacterium rubi]NTF04999.1 MarR family transcriptional regulator [Agrobacterium rubi]NTF08452.1 MarR family transcriptional regulator [Agrobacterium rubi]
MSKDKLAKKNKSEKKAKSGKKKDVTFNPEELAQSITQAARSMRTALSHNLAASGLYAGQDGVILALAQEGSMTPGQIAQKLGVKAPTMTRTIGRMEAQGFVERSAGDGDGRLTMVKLTEAGLKSVEHINASLADCNARAIEGLSAKDVKTVVKLLRSIDANLQPFESID